MLTETWVSSIVKPRLIKFYELLSVPFALKTPDGQIQFQTPGFQTDKKWHVRSICVHGEKVGVLEDNSTPQAIERHEQALEYLAVQIEELLTWTQEQESTAKTLSGLWDEIHFYRQLSHEIGAIFDLRILCERIIEKIVQTIGLKRASIMLLTDDGHLQITASHGLRTGLNGQLIDLTQGISGWVVQQARALLINHEKQVPDEIKLRLLKRQQADEPLNDAFISVPLICVPLKSNVKVVGVINIAQKLNASGFSGEEFKLLQAIASLSASMIHNLQQHQEAERVENMRKELWLASQIQQGLLPQTQPEIPGFDAAGACLTAEAVGGDYFDFFHFGNRHQIVLADVTGHGISSAILMSSVRSTLRALLAKDPMQLTDVVFQLNNFIIEDAGSSGLFVTFFVISLQADLSHFSYINCGHIKPIYYCAQTDSAELLPSEGIPLGIMPQMHYLEHHREIARGDILLLLTDGLLEARNLSNEMFGLQRLEKTLRGHLHETAERIVSQIFETVKNFSQIPTPADDMTIVVLKAN
jgi:serine phosphatase RsbU (regulator of sigma subunit)